MTALMTNLVHGTTQLLEGTAVLTASLAAVAVRISQPSATTPVRGAIDKHTLSDIGVEAGSLTWRR